MNKTLPTIKLPNAFVFEQVLDYLQRDKCAIIRITGRSMQPFIEEGDSVLLMPLDVKAVRMGAIVLARLGESMVLHRLVGHSEKSLLLAGDANLVQHERVSYQEAIACAVCAYRGTSRIELNEWRSRYAGLLWYKARPYRRLIKKLLKRNTYKLL